MFLYVGIKLNWINSELNFDATAYFNWISMYEFYIAS